MYNKGKKGSSSMAETYEYIPKGVCSRNMKFKIENDIIKDFNVVGGCSGNLQGIKQLILNRNIDEVISLLVGIKCGFKNTSCPDQIAKGFIEYKTKRSN